MKYIMVRNHYLQVFTIGCVPVFRTSLGKNPNPSFSPRGASIVWLVRQTFKVTGYGCYGKKYNSQKRFQKNWNFCSCDKFCKPFINACIQLCRKLCARFKGPRSNFLEKLWSVIEWIQKIQIFGPFWGEFIIPFLCMFAALT